MKIDLIYLASLNGDAYKQIIQLEPSEELVQKVDAIFEQVKQREEIIEEEKTKTTVAGRFLFYTFRKFDDVDFFALIATSENSEYKGFDVLNQIFDRGIVKNSDEIIKLSCENSEVSKISEDEEENIEIEMENRISVINKQNTENGNINSKSPDSRKVEIDQSDLEKEIEKVEKRKKVKYYIITAVLLTLIILAIVIPVSLTKRE